VKFPCLYADGTVERRELGREPPQQFAVQRAGDDRNFVDLDVHEIILTAYAFAAVVDGVKVRAVVYAESGADQRKLRDVAVRELRLVRRGEPPWIDD